MTKFKALVAGLALALISPAFGQSAGAQLPAGYYWGNPNGAQQRAIPASQSAMLDRALGSTRGAIIERGASGWALIGPSTTAGLPFLSGGTGADPAYQALTGAAFGTQNANTIYAGPSSGGAANPGFRPLVAADLPISVARQALSSPVTLYVNPSSTTGASCNGSSGGVGSDSNAGTLSAPFLTPAHALNVAQSEYDARLNQVTIQYCDNNVTGATYPTLQDTANMVGAISGGSGTAAQLIIQGNTTTPSNVVVQGSSGTAAFTFVGVTSPVLVSYMQIGASTSGAATTGHGIDADAHSMVYYAHITWGYIGSGYSHVVATYGSFVEQEGPETIIGGAANHWLADRVSQILTTGNTITCTGAPTFTSAFINLTNGSVFNLDGAAFSGCSAVTGPRYIADATSSFGSGTADPNTVFPGNSSGSVTLPSYGLNGLLVGNGGPPTGAGAPVTSMPAMNGDATLNLGTGGISVTKTGGTAFGPYATAALAQLPGSTTNDSASGGNIGELISSTVLLGSAVSLTNNTAANMTSISLSPGDWDVWCNLVFTGATTTTINYFQGGISTTSATLPGSNGDTQITVGDTGRTLFQNVNGYSMPTVGPTRVSLAATTTYYCVANAGFATSTASVYGKLQARRRR